MNELIDILRGWEIPFRVTKSYLTTVEYDSSGQTLEEKVTQFEPKVILTNEALGRMTAYAQADPQVLEMLNDNSRFFWQLYREPNTGQEYVIVSQPMKAVKIETKVI